MSRLETTIKLLNYLFKSLLIFHDFLHVSDLFPFVWFGFHADVRSFFPSIADTVPILTSTVIECHRVGFQKAAFLYASTLMRSEYRNQIDQKYAKKIEAIVRKAPNGIKDAKDTYQDEAQQCPICECNLQVMEMTCYQCKTNLPMCIATVMISTLIGCFNDCLYFHFVHFAGPAHHEGRCGFMSNVRFSLLQIRNDQVCTVHIDENYWIYFLLLN